MLKSSTNIWHSLLTEKDLKIYCFMTLKNFFLSQFFSPFRLARVKKSFPTQLIEKIFWDIFLWFLWCLMWWEKGSSVYGFMDVRTPFNLRHNKQKIQKLKNCPHFADSSFTIKLLPLVAKLTDLNFKKYKKLFKF